MTTETATPAERPASPATPQDDAPTTSWFMGAHESVTLPVSSQTLTISREISAKTSHEIYRGLPNEDTQGPMARWEEFSLRKAAAFLQAWSLPHALESTSAKRLEQLRAMRRGPFEKLYDVIATHEQEQPRRFCEGERYSKSEWAGKLSANEALPAEQRRTLPAFTDLLIYLEPTVTIDVDAWFLPQDSVVKLALPERHWITVRPELTQGQFTALVALEQKAKPGDEPSPFADWVAARKLEAYLVGWSMIYPGGGPVAPHRDAIAELDASKFQIILATINAYEERLQKEREANPI